MTWLHEHGVISSWWDYRALRISVIEDCRLVMEADTRAQQARLSENRRH